MTILLRLIVYASAAIFAAAIVARFLRIRNYPINIRWEIYPIPHEGQRSRYGGSKMEESEYWRKSHKPDHIMELKFMIPEMIFIKGLWDHNRKLWYRSFPFHFGLYLLTAFLALIAMGAVFELAGLPVAPGAGIVGSSLAALTLLMAAAGFLIGIPGAAAMIHARMTDPDLRPYTNPSHFFNLAFLLLVEILGLVVWLAVDRDFSLLRAFAASLLTFDMAAPVGGPLPAVAALLCALLIAYIPLTHMSHFFVKWFTWHRIRWDDAANVKGGRIEAMIQQALQRPVSWSGDHIRGDGKKTWVDVAVEEAEKHD